MKTGVPVDRALQSATATVQCALDGLAALRRAFSGESAGAVSSELAANFVRAVDVLEAARGRVIVTGVGKSGHIARKIAATFASTGKPAHFVHPADASHGDLGMIRGDDCVLALSWSGESAELSDIVAHSRRFRVPLIAGTGCAESTLARAADVVLALPACDEASADLLAPTTSSTLQLVLGDALAVALLGRGSFGADDFHRLHPAGRLGARLLRVRALMHTGQEVPLIAETATLSEAIVRMTGGRFGMTGVVDGEGRLAGVITDGDLRRAFATGFHDRAAAGVMSRSPRTAHPEELAQAALARMNAESITSLFVLEGDAVRGVLHIHDLLRAGLV